MRPKVTILVAGALMLLVVASTAWSQVTLVPYGACGWTYFQPTGVIDLASWSSKSLGGSGWAPGCTPFVKPWGCTSGTLIPIDGGIAIRRVIVNETQSVVPARYTVKGRCSMSVYYNGHPTSSGNLPNEYPLPLNTVLSGVIQLDPGIKVLLVYTYASAGTSNGQSVYVGGHLDVEVNADQVVTANYKASWGEVKRAGR